MASGYYRQYHLKNMLGHADPVWIPEEFAVLNKYVQIRRGTQWEIHLLVVEIGDRILAESVPEPDRGYTVITDPPT